MIVSGTSEHCQFPLKSPVIYCHVLSLFLQDEFTRRPMISRFLSNMANYEGGIAPNVEQIKEEEEAGKKKAKVSTILFFGSFHNRT